MASWGPLTKTGVGVTWVVAGRGRLRLNDTEWELNPSPCFCIHGADQVWTCIPASGAVVVTRAFWFGGPGLDGWLDALNVNRQPQFRLPRPARIHRAYRTMLQLVRHRPPNWEWKVHLLLVATLGEFLRARQLLAPVVRAQPPAITQVLNAIESDPTRDWKSSELAAAVRMSDTAFRILFRKTMHESPHAYLQRARLALARELLMDPTLRIKEIARRLHFSSGYYFSNFFRQHAGVRPTEFRQHLGIKSNDQRNT